MPPISDHPLRYTLANDLHARPFPKVGSPNQAAYLAIKANDVRDKHAERAHLINFPDRFGAAHPQPDATHYSGTIGRFTLKWEGHTKFVTYTNLLMALMICHFHLTHFLSSRRIGWRWPMVNASHLP